MTDAVDLLLQEWARERPDVDCSPIGVVGRVSRLSRILERGVKANFARHGLVDWEFDVLATLRRAGEPYQLTMNGILRASMITSGAVTNRIDRMEARGLVKRLPAEHDRRSVVVRLTAKGRRLVDEVLPGHVENERRLLAGLSARDEKQLVGLLRKLLLSLDDTR
ncbi:MAG: MarR family winged helix-turn-helix transcriptional regulator [Micromonosporaceae bacterium]